MEIAIIDVIEQSLLCLAYRFSQGSSYVLIACLRIGGLDMIENLVRIGGQRLELRVFMV